MSFRTLSTAVAALAISVSLLANPPCLTGTWGTRGVSAQYAVAGDRLIAADGRGLAVYDISNSATVRLLTAAVTDSPSRHVAVSGHQAFVTTDTQLLAYDIGPDSLTLIASAPLTGAPIVAAGGSRVITAGTDLILWSFGGGELSPSSTTTLPSPATALLLDGNVLYVAEQDTGIEVMDVSSGAPVPISTPVAVAAQGLARSGNYLYAGSGGQGLNVIDVSDPRNARWAALVQAGDVDLRDVAVSGSTLYATDHLKGSRIVVFSLADPLHPSPITVLDEPVTAIAAAGEQLYVSGSIRHTNGSITQTGAPLRIFDASDPAHPYLIGEVRDYAGPLGGAATDGSFAYVADPPLFRVIDIRVPSAPVEVARLPIDDSSDRVRLRGRMALVYGRANVHLVDVADPFRPAEIGVYRSLGIPPNGADMAGPYLLEANRPTGFHVLDITNPAQPRQIGGLKNDGFGQYFGLVSRPGVAYALVAKGIKVNDLTVPNHPVFTKMIVLGSPVDDAIAPAADGRPELLLAIDGSNLRFYSLDDPLNPQEISSAHIPLSVALTVEGATAWVVTQEHSLVEVNFADPLHPSVVSTTPGLLQPTQVDASGNIVVVADTYALRIYSTEAQPSDAPLLSLSGTPAASAARLAWISGWPGPFEVQTAPTEDFAAPATVSTGLHAIVIPVSGPVWVRVRAAGGCGNAGPWSNTISIEARDDGIIFEEQGRHVIVGAAAGEFVLPIAMRNLSASPVTASIGSEASPGVVVPASIALPGGGTGLLEVRIDPALLGAETTVHLASSGGSSFALTITRVSATASPAQSGGTFLVLAGVASIQGKGTTKWRSDLQLYCSANPECRITARFVPFGAPDQAVAATLSLRGGETVVITDVVQRLFGQSAAGSIEIASPDLEAVHATATTYNDSPTGRFGQRITPATIDPNDVDQGITRQLLGIVQNATARTNIGLVNETGKPVVVGLSLVDTAGMLRATRSVGLLPGASTQPSLAQLFPAGIPIDAGYVNVSGPRGVIAYASRVDQRTDDGVFSLGVPREDGAREITFPSAASLRGALSTNWRTSFQLAASGGPATAEITFVPAGNPDQARTATVTIDPASSFFVSDLVDSLFPELSSEESVLGWLKVRSDQPLTGWEYIYNETAAGNYGQYIPASGVDRETDASAALNAVATIYPVEESAARRTNVGLTEIGGKPALVRITVFDSAGSVLAVTDRFLSAYSTQLIPSLLAELGLSGLRDGRIELVRTAGEGEVKGYASVVENATGDASFIPAE